MKAVINVDDYSGSAQALAATTLRKVWCASGGSIDGGDIDGGSVGGEGGGLLINQESES